MLLALVGQSRTGTQRLAKLIREGRKRNLAAILSTQSPADFYNSPMHDVILQNTPTKIWLPDSWANSKDGRRIYQEMGISEKNIVELGRREPKREYLFTQDGYETWIDFEFSAETIRLLTQKGVHEDSDYMAAAGR